MRDRSRRLFFVAVAVMTAALWGPWSAAQQPATQPRPAAREAEAPGAQAPEPEAMVEERPQQVILLHAGQSQVITAPWPVRRVSVINPAIADVFVISPRQVQVQAIAPGVTDLALWSEEEEIWRARVEVELDLRRIEGQLGRVFPRSELAVSQVGEVVVVSGNLMRTEQSLQLRQLLEASRLNYLDLTSVSGLQQVQLRVRVAEVSRQALRQLNINWFAARGDVIAGNQLGSSESPFTAMAGFVPGEVPPTAQLFAVFPNENMEFFIQAMVENQYLRMLAEPTLVALSGEEAQFLAGGEIPIPRSESTGGSTQISIDWREHGIRLRFRPTVLGDGGIRLVVEPEVSELTDVGSVIVLGVRVPALLTRRAITTLELQDGQTFALAGLLSHRTNARTSRVPVLGSVPILGTLFRSVRYSVGETELVILVTAELVEPQSVAMGELPFPGVIHRPPNNWELFIRGNIEGAPPRMSPVHSERMQEMGLDKLRGPGAWASYERSHEQPRSRRQR